jgi:hypothetical protein
MANHRGASRRPDRPRKAKARPKKARERRSVPFTDAYDQRTLMTISRLRSTEAFVYGVGTAGVNLVAIHCSHHTKNDNKEIS